MAGFAGSAPWLSGFKGRSRLEDVSSQPKLSFRRPKYTICGFAQSLCRFSTIAKYMLEKLQEIMWRVTAAGDLNEALEIVVRRVKAAMNTDVCSVYVRDPASHYVLMEGAETVRNLLNDERRRAVWASSFRREHATSTWRMLGSASEALPCRGSKGGRGPTFSRPLSNRASELSPAVGAMPFSFT